MPDLLLSSVEYGGYISPIKLIVFLVSFFVWLWLVGWIYEDAKTVETKEVLWTAVILAAGAVALIIWLVAPLFAIGILLYPLLVGGVSIVYVKHRNARVLDYDRVLTADHIKSLFAKKQKKADALKSFAFVTANDNEVPVPQPRTPDFYGYQTAYDILNDAILRRASDILLTPTQQDYNVAYYIDGVATKRPDVVREQAKYFIRFMKSLADLDVNEKRKPQKGRFKISRNKEKTEWEVTTAGSTMGEQVKLKQAGQKDIIKLADIGLMSDQYEQLSKFRELKQGLFIVSGPKKSGVTSTFYALLRNHDAFLNSINTLEKQPSADLPNIVQKAFGPNDAQTTTYAKRLQAIVRMGPDIVGVADCTDSETAQAACTAAKDGKIIYVTLEAENVIQAMGKWIQLIGDKNLVADSLLGISNQRLLRKLCDKCKQAYSPNKELLRKFNIPAEKAKVLYRADKEQVDRHGKSMICENCQGTGFVGRTGVFEVITINDELRNAVKQLKSLSEIGAQFRHAKMLYLQEQALRKVVNGTTAINEMIRVFSPPQKQQAKKPEPKT